MHRRLWRRRIAPSATIVIRNNTTKRKYRAWAIGGYHVPPQPLMTFALRPHKEPRQFAVARKRGYSSICHLSTHKPKTAWTRCLRG